MLKIVTMVSVYNHEDIIEAVFKNLLKHKLSIVALDNNSTDRSYEICSEYAVRGDILLYRWEPEGIDLELLSIKLYHMALGLEPDWLLFNDADEILETREPGLTLREAINRADDSGYNIMQFDRYDFFITNKDDASIASPVDRLKFYSWQSDHSYRAFKNITGITAKPSFAHYPIFPEEYTYNISPEKLVMRHYPYRDFRQAEEKIETILRKTKGETRKWRNRYQRIADEAKHIQTHDCTRLHYFMPGSVMQHEKRYAPFTNKHPLKEELYTENGKLRIRPIAEFDWRKPSVLGE